MSAKKSNPRQLEVLWLEPEPMKLVIETAQDGERIASDKARIIDLKNQSEKLQEKFA